MRRLILTLELPRGVHHPPVFFKRHIFLREFFRNASIHLWATHFQIFWCTYIKKVCSHVNLLASRKKVKCLGGSYQPPRSQLLDKIGKKFQQLPLCFRGKESNGTIGNTVRRNRKSEIQDDSLQSGNTFISICRHDSNNILTAIPMFSGPSNPIWLLEILCDITGSWKSKMAVYKPDVPISQLVYKSSIIYLNGFI